MITPAAGASPPPSPARRARPLPGIGAELVDDARRAGRARAAGYLTLTRPWPSMLRGIWGDPERYADTYWSRFEGRYFAGDGAKVDDDGYFWLLGRVDDVMNVSGPPHLHHRGRVRAGRPPGGRRGRRGRRHRPHHRPGHRRLRDPPGRPRALATSSARRSASTWRPSSAPIARPRAVIIVPDLPKTRSGKIMRRLLRDVVEGRALGDTTTLADATWSAIRIESRLPPTSRAADRGSSPRGHGRTSTSARPARRADLDPTRQLALADEPSAPAVVFDIDGVLSDAASRQHYIEYPVPGLGGVLPRLRRRRLIDEVARLLDVLDPDHRDRAAHRPAACGSQPQTLAWLDRYGLRWDLLDHAGVRRLHGAPAYFKQRTVCELRGRGFDLRLAFEDDPRNVAMFHGRGTCPASTSTPATTTERVRRRPEAGPALRARGSPGGSRPDVPR